MLKSCRSAADLRLRSRRVEGVAERGVEVLKSDEGATDVDRDRPRIDMLDSLRRKVCPVCPERCDMSTIASHFEIYPGEVEIAASRLSCGS
jgi:hypothetical protein